MNGECGYRHEVSGLTCTLTPHGDERRHFNHAANRSFGAGHLVTPDLSEAELIALVGASDRSGPVLVQDDERAPAPGREASRSDTRKTAVVLAAAWILSLTGTGLTHATGNRIYAEAAVIVLGALAVAGLVRLVVLAVQLRAIYSDFRDIGRSWNERHDTSPEAIARRERLRRKYGEPS